LYEEFNNMSSNKREDVPKPAETEEAPKSLDAAKEAPKVETTPKPSKPSPVPQAAGAGDDAKVQAEAAAPGPSVDPSRDNKLETPWSFWYDRKKPRGTKAKDYQKGLKKIGQFDSIESFYRFWAYMKKPSTLEDDINIYLFRNELQPAWETFPKGGHWIIKVTKGNGLINHLWDELVISVIGELFETPDVVGVALQTRKRNDILTIWNEDNSDQKFTIIGERLKSILNLHHSTTVEYKPFADAIQDRSSTHRARQYMYVASH